MTDSWIIAFPCNRAQAESLTDEHPALAAFEPAPVLVASELDEDRDEWQIEAYTEGRPTKKLIETMMALLGRKNRKAPKPRLLPNEDWVTLSQAGLEPVRAGRFHVHTGQDAPDLTPGVVNFRIDAGQAFGTGHHDTTAGCLLALDRLKAQGHRYSSVADIGTGTGLLAFAALHLWPRAFAVASDIDPVSVQVSAENAQVNGIPCGFGPGKLVLVAADGTRHPLITEAGPYDLVCANILAGPLIALAPSLAEIVANGGQLVLAGLLDTQRDAVIAAYRRVGFRVDERSPGAQWPVLILTMRRRLGWRRPIRANGSAGQVPGDFGSW
jgi:ribosomal protein L11 methyltransferase